MNYAKGTFVGSLLVAVLCEVVSAKGGKGGGSGGGRGKGWGKGRKHGTNNESVNPLSLQNVTVCMGQPVDLKLQVETTVQNCLDEHTKNVNKQLEDTWAGKAPHQLVNLNRTKVSIGKRIKKRCAAECEFKSFDLVPDVNKTCKNYPAVNISDSFLKPFSKVAQESLKVGLQRCYSSKTPNFPSGEHELPAWRMCRNNAALVECLRDAVDETCAKDGGTSGNAESTKATTMTS